LFCQANETSNPLRKDRMIQAAELSQLIHPQIQRLLCESGRPTGDGPPGALPIADTRQLLEMVGRHLALTESITCNKKTKRTPAGKPKATEPFSRDSESDRPNSPR
jgi:hypothetical protein